MRWLLVGLLLLGMAGASVADTLVYNTADRVLETDRDKLWNPFVGYAPWHGPLGYRAAPVASTSHVHHEDDVHHHTVSHRHGLGHRDGDFCSDRDHLWNPFLGETPWLEAPAAHKYHPRQ